MTNDCLKCGGELTPEGGYTLHDVAGFSAKHEVEKFDLTCGKCGEGQFIARFGEFPYGKAVRQRSAGL